MSGYQRINFKDQNVERPKTYDVTNNPDGSITLIESFGNVEELGTPINQENMNHIEDGIAAVSFSKFNINSVYQQDEFVTYVENNQLKIYKSLIDNNFGNELADVSFWEEVKFAGGGSGAYLGQTIFSLDPLYEDTLHLLDGALLQVGGIYDEFINNYIAKLYVSNPERFCTEAQWQTSLSTYGVCGKYVYNEGVSVRLPRVTGIVEGTLDANALGEIVEAGLPNIKGTLAGIWNDDSTLAKYTGAFKSGKDYETIGGATGGGQDKVADFDASRSSSIYKNNFNKVQPQTVQGYFYIAVASGSKTDIEVNLDNIATDLNGKADTDLTNLSTEGRATGARLAMPSSNFIVLEWGASGSAYIAPANGYINAQHGITGTTGNFSLQLNINERMFDKKWAYLPSTTSASVLCTTIPVKKGDTVSLIYQYPQNPTITTTLIRFFYAEGEV